ncbi:MAG: efflux RND transporter periplasmic adaptor subunit [Gemmataceae bacterium]|nr:efflux RND transporter periplasmic adaptor subunit [Gemmataceae bacterium]
MDSPATLERRKQVRVLRRRDLIVAPQQYEGRRHYVVKDPIALRYYRFKEQEQFILDRLDGTHTLADVQQEFEQQYRPRRLTLEEVELFVHQLVSSGLAHPATDGAGKQLLDRARQQQQRSVRAALQNFLAIRLPLCDPDRLLTGMLPYFRWMFGPGAAVVSTAIMLAALFLAAVHFDVFWQRLPAAHEFFGWKSLLHLWLALALVKVVHEFGHGLTCKAFGGEVHEMGVLLLCFAPSLYCNVSDSWTMPSKWRRIFISFAGIYVELTIAAVATFLWWNTSSASFVHQLSLSLMVVCSVNTVLFNGNPLMRYDGYYIFADWLETPNLSERAARFWKRRLLHGCLGIEVTPEPAEAPWRRCLLASYGAASAAYRWVVTFGVLWFLTRFLKPYRLEALGGVMAAFTVLMMVGAPPLRIGRFLFQRGRMPAMKWQRIGISAGLLGATAAAFCFAPLPISRIHQVGAIEMRPDASARVFVSMPGILQRLYVRNGQRVSQGDVIAEFRSLDLENLRAEALLEQDTHALRLQSLREVAAATVEEHERARIEAELTRLVGDRQRAARQADTIAHMLKRLQVRAPRSGVVMGLPGIDEIGKHWEKDGPTPLCTIGDLDQLWALVPLDPASYRLLKEELADARQRHAEPSVELRILGRCQETCRGQIAQLPESEAKDVPWALAQKCGGPLPIKPGTSSQVAVPQSQQYIVAVALENADGTVRPGNLAQVSIHCRWRTGAWWVWRTVAATFDVGLL